ncbi:YcnI family copper-binding membrane protein [Arthrobacter sp. R4-81]
MNKSILPRAISVTGAIAGTAALMMAGSAGASAHVGISPDKTTANSYALLTFGIPHGCDTSGTTKVTITLPQELNDAQPTVNPNWTIEKVEEELASPKKTADGATITKRTSKIVYTAKAPLDAKLRDALVLSVKLPDAAGTTLYFPTLQNCQVGQTDWAEIPKDGQDPHSLEAPAPSVTISDGSPQAAGSHASEQHSGTSAAAVDSATDQGAEARSWAGLAAGVGGLALGGVAFIRSRGTKKDSLQSADPSS